MVCFIIEWANYRHGNQQLAYMRNSAISSLERLKTAWASGRKLATVAMNGGRQSWIGCADQLGKRAGTGNSHARNRAAVNQSCMTP